jgi:hypothetical protein
MPPEASAESVPEAPKHTLDELKQLIQRVHSRATVQPRMGSRQDVQVKREKGGEFKVYVDPESFSDETFATIFSKALAQIEQFEFEGALAGKEESAEELALYRKRIKKPAHRLFYQTMFQVMALSKGAVHLPILHQYLNNVGKKAVKSLHVGEDNIPLHIQYLFGLMGLTEGLHEDVLRVLSELREAGFIGYVLHTQVPYKTKLKYLNDDLFSLYDFFLEKDLREWRKKKPRPPEPAPPEDSEVEDGRDDVQSEVEEVLEDPAEDGDPADDGESPDDGGDDGDGESPDDGGDDGDGESEGDGGDDGDGESEGDGDGGGGGGAPDEDTPDHKDRYKPQEGGGGLEEAPEGQGYKLEIFPPLTGHYVVDRKNRFDARELAWDRTGIRAPYVQNVDFVGEKYTISGILSGSGRKAIPLPSGYALDIDSLTIVSGARPQIIRDSNGNFFFNIRGKVEFSIDFYKEKNPVRGGVSAEDTKATYSGRLSSKAEGALQKARNASTDKRKAELIRDYIRRNHFYPAGGNDTDRFNKAIAHQGELAKDCDTSTEYIQKLDKATHLDCFSAATLMTSMARAVGLPCRIATGHHVEGTNDDGNSVISLANAHGWVEVYVDSIWKRFDATPPADPNEKKEDKEEDDDSSDSDEKEGDDDGKEKVVPESADDDGVDTPPDGGGEDGEEREEQEEGGEGSDSDGDESDKEPGDDDDAEGGDDDAEGGGDDAEGGGDDAEGDGDSDDAEGGGDSDDAEGGGDSSSDGGDGGGTLNLPDVDEYEDDPDFDAEKEFEKMYEELKDHVSDTPEEGDIQEAIDQMQQEQLELQKEEEPRDPVREELDKRFPGLSEHDRNQLEGFVKHFLNECEKMKQIPNPNAHPSLPDPDTQNPLLIDALRDILRRVISRSIIEEQQPQFPVSFGDVLVDPVQLYLDQQDGVRDSVAWETVRIEEHEELKVVKVRRRKILDGSISMRGATLELQQLIEVLENLVTAEKQEELDQLSGELDRDVRLETETWQFGVSDPGSLLPFRCLKKLSAEFDLLDQAITWQMAGQASGGTNDFDPLEAIYEGLLDEDALERQEQSEKPTVLERIKAGFYIRELKNWAEYEEKGGEDQLREDFDEAKIEYEQALEAHNRTRYSGTEEAAENETKAYFSQIKFQELEGHLIYFKNLESNIEQIEAYLEELEGRFDRNDIEPIIEVIEVSTDGGSNDARRVQLVIKKLRELGVIVIGYGLGREGAPAINTYANPYNPLEGGVHCQNILDYPIQKERAWRRVLDKA